MMKNRTLLLSGIGLLLASLCFSGHRKGPVAFKTGNPDIQSMSALEISPDGELFIGDSRAGKIIALDLLDSQTVHPDEKPSVADLDIKMAALLGSTAEDIMIHDMAVNPASKNIYFAVSRGGKAWTWEFNLPNDVSDATALIKLNPAGELSLVDLSSVKYAEVELSNPTDDSEHAWKKGVSSRVDAISYLSFHKGKLYVAGLSNEEFSSTMRIFPYPFVDELSSTSLEIFHGAHGKWETKSPVRSFIPLDIEGKDYLLAAYLCTPLVMLPVDGLKDGAHLKGRTIAELGAGNYPLDIVQLKKKDKDIVVIANSNRTMMHYNLEDLVAYEGEITEKASTMSGAAYIPLSGGTVYQMDKYDDEHIVVIRRGPNGRLKLDNYPSRWL